MTENNNDTDITYKKKHVARFIAILASYSCSIKNDSLDDLTNVTQAIIQSYLKKEIFFSNDGENYVNEIILIEPEREFLENLINILVLHETKIIEMIQDCLNEKWNFNRLDNVIKAILKLATAEILYHQEIAAKIIIDEYVSLTKTFYENNEAGFVNKVLDTIVLKNRENKNDEEFSANLER